MVVLIGFFWLVLNMAWVKSYLAFFSVSKYSITCVECLNLKFPRIRGEMKTWCLFLFHLFRTWIKLLSRFVPRETILKDQQIEVPEASIVVTWAAAAIVANIVFSCKFFPQSICTCKLYIALLWMIFCSFLQNCHIICLESLFHLFFVQKFQKRNEELVHKSQPDDNSIWYIVFLAYISTKRDL